VQTQASQSIEPEADAEGMLLFAMRRAKQLLIGAAVGTVVGVALAFLLRPTYRAEIKVVAVDQNADSSALTEMMGKLGGLADLAGLGNANLSGGKNVTLELLKSRSFARRFVVQEGIEATLLEGKAKEPAANSVSFRALRRFNNEVRSVSEDKRSGIITIAMRWKDPEVAAKWANDYVDLFNADMRAKASGEAQRNLQYLEKRLGSTSDVGVRQALYKLMGVELKNAMLADIRTEYAAKIVDRAQEPDRKDRASPNRPLVVAGGAAAGLVLTMLFMLFMHLRARLHRTVDRT
jgi:uncharacterized protein involved in exopolysaccharide biosynthesis